MEVHKGNKIIQKVPDTRYASDSLGRYPRWRYSGCTINERQIYRARLDQVFCRNARRGSDTEQIPRVSHLDPAAKAGMLDESQTDL